VHGGRRFFGCAVAEGKWRRPEPDARNPVEAFRARARSRRLPQGADP